MFMGKQGVGQELSEIIKNQGQNYQNHKIKKILIRIIIKLGIGIRTGSA